MARYALRHEEADRWTVIDGLTGFPVIIGSSLATDMIEEDALALAADLNDEHSSAQPTPL